MDLPLKRQTRQHAAHLRHTPQPSEHARPSSRDGTNIASEVVSVVQEQVRKQMPDQAAPSTNLDPYTTLGQLSYAPATQTTVVTTTTTTTTSFPPLLFKAPQPLRDRDPKQYPLAFSATPPSLKNLQFDIGGQPVFFQETNDVEGALDDYSQRRSELEDSNGMIQSVFNSGVSYDTPDIPSQKNTKDTMMRTRGAAASKLGRRRRSQSPPSLAEAAEIASLQRRNKKPRVSAIERFPSNEHQYSSKLSQTVDDSGPATPDTDAGTSGQFKMPPSGGRLRRPSLKSHSKNTSSSSWEDIHRAHSRPSLLRPGFNPLTGPSQGAPAAGVSATPPIVEGDLERVLPYEQDDLTQDSQQTRHPQLLDTVAAQDASLPSPSLSPITAAANAAALLPGAQEQDEDENEVSSLDISQDSLEGNGSGSLLKRRASTELHQLELPQPYPVASPNPQLLTPTLADIAPMLDTFDSFPHEWQQVLMFHLLKRCPKPTLRLIADTVNPALNCDFLDMLPLELSLNIAKYLDAKSMCRAAQVSRKWRQILDSDETAWKDLMDQDDFQLPEGELEQAIREGWGWQFPYGIDSGEEDLRCKESSDCVVVKPKQQDSPKSTTSSSVDSDVTIAASGRPKRKAATQGGRNNKKKRKGPPVSKLQPAPWASTLSEIHGPIAHANAALVAVPNPDVGLASLRNLHLYKSLYRRHHLIRKSWMQEEMKPRHIAFRAHQRHVVTCLQFDTDKILTGSDDTKINVYDTQTGARRKVLEGHEGGVWALEYEGNTLVSGSTDRSVRVWDIEAGKCLQVFQGHTSTVRCLVILKPAQVGTYDDGTPKMMPRQPLIITGSRDSSLRVWKLPKPTDKGVFQAGPPSNDYDNPYFVRALTGHHHSVRAIAAHGDTLVSGSYDCTVRVWKISTGEMQHRLSGHSQKVYSVVLDHERNRCISGSMDNMVKVWSLEFGTCLFNLEGHSSLVGLLDLSHERLVSAAADSTLRIWDPENGQCKATLTAHTGAITCFQHDDQKVISGSDRTLKMWNVKTGECVKDLLTDLSGVWQVRFNERRCVAAVQRNNLTYIEVLDFGASRDGEPLERRGVRVVVDKGGREIKEMEDEDDGVRP